MNNPILQSQSNRIKKAVRFIGPKAIVFYLIVYACAQLLFDCKTIFDRGRRKALNRLLPDIAQLAKFEENKNADKKILEEAKFYYQKVIEYIPQTTAAYGMLGFCYYHLGEVNKAIELYQKAIELKPDFFTFHYNLAVIYYERNEFKKSAALLKKALLTDLKDNINFVTSSKIYFFFWEDKDKIVLQFNRRFKKHYLDAYKLIVLDYYHLRDFPQAILPAKKAMASGLSDEGFFLYWMGKIFYELGQYRQAMPFLKEAALVDPQNASALRLLGLCLKFLDENEEGEAALQRAEYLSSGPGQKATTSSEADFKPFLF